MGFDHPPGLRHFCTTKLIRSGVVCLTPVGFFGPSKSAIGRINNWYDHGITLPLATVLLLMPLLVDP